MESTSPESFLTEGWQCLQPTEPQSSDQYLATSFSKSWVGQLSTSDPWSIYSTFRIPSPKHNAPGIEESPSTDTRDFKGLHSQDSSLHSVASFSPLSRPPWGVPAQPHSNSGSSWAFSNSTSAPSGSSIAELTSAASQSPTTERSSAPRRRSTNSSSVASQISVIYCEACNTGFTGKFSRQNLWRHRRWKHQGIARAPTCVCGKVFRRSDALLKHKRSCMLPPGAVEGNKSRVSEHDEGQSGHSRTLSSSGQAIQHRSRTVPWSLERSIDIGTYGEANGPGETDVSPTFVPLSYRETLPTGDDFVLEREVWFF